MIKHGKRALQNNCWIIDFFLKGGNDAKGARNVIKLITLTPTYRLRDSPCENLNKRKKEKTKN